MNPKVLEAECEVFARYLADAPPDGSIVATYVEAHRVRPELEARDRFDRALLAVARTGRPATRLADAHARIFARGSALRRKLVLVLAILETSPSSFEKIDEPGTGPGALALARLVVHGLRAAAALVLGAAILLPVQLACRLGGRRG